MGGGRVCDPGSCYRRFVAPRSRPGRVSQGLPRIFPEVDLVTTSGSIAQESPRGPYRQELLYALRRTQDNDTAIWNAAPALNKLNPPIDPRHAGPWPVPALSAAAPPAFPPQSVSPAAVASSATAPKSLPIVVTLPVARIEPSHASGCRI